MGIKHLWKLLNGRTVELRELNGLSLCVDANLALFACLGTSNIVFITEYTLKVIYRLISLGIDPVFVFDGRKPLFKKRPRKEILGTGGNGKDVCTEIEQVPEETADMPSTYINEDSEATDTLEREEDFRQNMSDGDFSMYQVQKVFDRYKYIRSLTKIKRMHGDSEILFKLKSHSLPVVQAKEDPDTDEPFKELNACMEKMKEILYSQQDGTEEKVERKMSYSRDIEREKKEKGQVHRIEVPTEETEYQREMKMYELPKEDIFLNTRAIDKETLPLAYRVIVDILDAFSIKYAIASSESDNVYKSIERAIDMDGVVTEDSDILIFSKKPVFRHVFKRKILPKVFAEEGVLEYTQTELHILAWLLGNDYVPGISGIGPSRARIIIGKYREAVSPQNAEEDTINIDQLCEIVRSTVNRDVTLEIPNLLQVQKVYADREFKVHIANLAPKPLDKRKIVEFLAKRTSWESTEKEGYFKMINEYQKNRENKLEEMKESKNLQETVW
ncbi:hypothetical protein NEAUS05_1014 [Nematocida ausubeli]|nr:hypothetical protein NEAUS05_1014 [Nematocida ausubeli]